MVHNVSNIDNQLKLREITPKKVKILTFCVLLRTVKSLSFLSVRNFFEKVSNKDKTYNKDYSVRLIDSIRLMNASLDAHVDNLSNKIYNLQYCLKKIQTNEYNPNKYLDNLSNSYLYH